MRSEPHVALLSQNSDVDMRPAAEASYRCRLHRLARQRDEFAGPDTAYLDPRDRLRTYKLPRSAAGPWDEQGQSFLRSAVTLAMLARKRRIDIDIADLSKVADEHDALLVPGGS